MLVNLYKAAGMLSSILHGSVHVTNLVLKKHTRVNRKTANHVKLNNRSQYKHFCTYSESALI